MQCELANRSCVPCRQGAQPLTGEALTRMASLVDPGWNVVDAHHIEREFRCKDFCDALALTNTIGEIAEQQGHHPTIHLSWGKVRVTIHTHKIDGLTESDFILAAHIDAAV